MFLHESVQWYCQMGCFWDHEGTNLLHMCVLLGPAVADGKVYSLLPHHATHKGRSL